TTQPLVARNVPRAGDTTVYVETAAGFVYALAADGYVRWRVDLGRLTFDPCQVIPDGFGVTGTPVIDPSTRTLYVADAFGRLHALDLATGAERPGWPVVLYDDPKKELDWGALLLADGSVYVGTGSYCDLPMVGKLIRVQLATRKVSAWEAVPASLGGGGSVWGWGGPAYSAKRDSIYVVTGNAFEGGTNKGTSFSEEAGYGEHLVELSPDLNVRSSDAPPLAGFTDVDYVGSPVIVDTKDCGELVAAQAKNGMFFGWRADAVGSGPVWALKLQKADPGAPLLTQPTWSPQLRSFYVATASKLVRIALGTNCQAKVTWQTSLGESTLYPSPTVAGSTVWVGLPVKDLSGVNEALLGVDAKTGRVLVRRPIAGVSFAPPSALPGMLFMATMHGLGSIRFPVAHGRPVSALPEYTSRLDAQHVWQSREDGVYSTDDGGKHWRRIYPSFAARVVRLSAASGVISVGAPAPACGCSTQRLWTSDGGRTWKVARGIGEDFEGSGSTLYWWSGSALFLADPGFATSKKIATADGPIVDGAAAGGAVVLVDRRSKPPEVIVAHGSSTQTVTLPAGPTAAVVRSIAASGSTVVVAGRDYSSPGTGPDPSLSWHSHDGGVTWTLGS
ncbi:MAG TPA: PQQ-binding-like beta-propeller repeat protein, partial [Gaiellaceae bacterium]|nr:PQQ-binding-like beta-propeller repeat protein [Gaiellaceae bacterium]